MNLLPSRSNSEQSGMAVNLIRRTEDLNPPAMRTRCLGNDAGKSHGKKQFRSGHHLNSGLSAAMLVIGSGQHSAKR